MTDYNGGYQVYANRTRSKTFFRACDRATKTVTVKSGQVIKALSFLESDVNGKVIAHGGLVESALVTFDGALTSGQTCIIAGLTFTAGSGGASAIQIAAAWSDLAIGTTAAVAAAAFLAKGYATTVGTFNTGTLAGYATTGLTTTKVRFDAQGTGAVDATDIAQTGTDCTTVAITQYAALNNVAGVLAFDVDATSADVEASAYIEGSFWADALVWAVDVAVDTITKFDGTTIAVTAYNTGAAGTSAASNLLKQKFVEGTEFEELGFLSAGETL